MCSAQAHTPLVRLYSENIEKKEEEKINVYRQSACDTPYAGFESEFISFVIILLFVYWIKNWRMYGFGYHIYATIMYRIYWINMILSLRKTKYADGSIYVYIIT